MAIVAGGTHNLVIHGVVGGFTSMFTTIAKSESVKAVRGQSDVTAGNFIYDSQQKHA